MLTKRESEIGEIVAIGPVGDPPASKYERLIARAKQVPARLALDYFVYRVGLYTGMLAAAMGGLDAFVFTAGIGENSPSIRARIVEKIGWLGASLDEDANETCKTLISNKESRIDLYLIPTDEELMIARHTLAVMKNMRVAAE